MQSGIVFDIREFTVHDGPGLRTTVFLKGCPLRCSWCHNPEGLEATPQAIDSPAGLREVGRRYTSVELATLLNKQAEILRNSEGGVTFSGGEPLQQAAFVAEVMEQLDATHVVLDTSGYGTESDFRLVASRCNLVYFDLKIIDPALHRRYTGVDNAPILRNLEMLAVMKIPCVIRVPLIPGVTDSDDNLDAIATIASRLPCLTRVDLLPYNRAAGGKYRLCNKKFSPQFDELRAINVNTEIFEAHGLTAILQ